MGIQKPPKPKVDEAPFPPVAVKSTPLPAEHSHTAAELPKPSATAKLFGLVVVSGGVLRVVSVELPVTEVDVIAARLPAENALERINLEIRNLYMQSINRRSRPSV